jgi:hypothetical protein
MRASTRGWGSGTPDKRLITFLLPTDFGSHAYFERRHESIEKAIKCVEESADLISLFEKNVEPSESFRDYLWVNEYDYISAARISLKVLPKSLIIASLRWAVEDFNSRRSGWPDLLVFREGEFLFSEVKSPHDKLSHEQMNWFRWAVKEAAIPCELVKVKQKSQDNAT